MTVRYYGPPTECSCGNYTENGAISTCPIHGVKISTAGAPTGAPTGASLAGQTPSEALEDFRQKAMAPGAPHRDRLIAEMIDTLRIHANHWRQKIVEYNDLAARSASTSPVATADQRGQLLAVETALVESLDKRREAEARVDGLLADNTRLELARREATAEASAARTTLASVERELAALRGALGL